MTSLGTQKKRTFSCGSVGSVTVTVSWSSSTGSKETLCVVSRESFVGSLSLEMVSEACETFGTARTGSGRSFAHIRSDEVSVVLDIAEMVVLPSALLSALTSGLIILELETLFSVSSIIELDGLLPGTGLAWGFESKLLFLRLFKSSWLTSRESTFLF